MPDKAPDKRGVFELVEGFHLAHALAALRELEVLADLAEPTPPERLAERHGLDPEILERVLEYLAARTGVIEASGNGFRVTADFDDYAGFLLDQYLGAYGPNAAALAEVLRHPDRAGDLVDRKRHAEAFARLGRPGVAVLPGLIRQLELDCVLDLGCGPGALLIALAESDSDFRGWGVDASAEMCEQAAARATDAGVADRLRFYRADAARFAEAVPAAELDRVRSVVAASLLNELFARGHDAAVGFLAALRRALPERTLLVSDYYGCLGHPEGRFFAQTALHDFVQLISGQGVPPPDLAAWQAIYQQAGCGLVHALEDERASGFIHILRLG